MAKLVDVPGQGVVEFPDNMSDEQIAQVLRGQQMPPLMAAMGNLAGGAVRGAGSIGATLLAPLDMAKDAMAGKGLSLESNRQRRADMDAALNNLGFDTQSGWFQGGKLLSEVGGTMGVGGALARGAQALGAAPSVVSALNTAGFSTGNVPTTLAGRAGDMALRSAAGAVTGAASAGLVNPEQADVGAITGGALPVGVKLAGMAGNKIGGMFRPTPANVSLADKAINQYGIPLSVADVSNSALVKGARSALDDVPIIGGIGRRQREAVQNAFNREIGKTFGENADSLTPQVLDSAKKRMGAEFDRIWNRNALQFDGTLFQQIQQLRNNAAKLPQGEQARLSSWLDDFENKLAADPQGNLYMAGDVANRFQSTLRREAEKAASFLKDDLSNLRKSVIDAFNRSVSPSDAAALTKNRGQYKAFKTVEDLLQGAEAGVAGRSAGDVPAALLPQAVRKSYGANISNSPFADLSQIGSQYVADRVARTGGSARAMFQNSALGSGLALGAWTNPMVPALAIPSAFGLEGLLSSPAVARRLLNPSTSGLLMSPDLYRPIPVIAADQ